MDLEGLIFHIFKVYWTLVYDLIFNLIPLLVSEKKDFLPSELPKLKNVAIDSCTWIDEILAYN